eukprot:Nk52_evm10s276 gene=Nk52_evmTU10s276
MNAFQRILVTDSSPFAIVAKHVDMIEDYAEKFEYKEGVTPLSDPIYPIAISFFYLFVIYTLKGIVRNVSLPLPQFVFSLYHFVLRIGEFVHNLILSLGSLLLCYLLIKTTPQLVELREIFETKNGDLMDLGKAVFMNITSLRPFQEGKIQGAFWFYMYVYYMSKYYELFDTVFMVLRGRSTQLLHVWHHFMVVTLMYFAFRQKCECFWLLDVINTGIHFIMYMYYAAVTLSIKPGVGVKKFITTSQLVQFVVAMSYNFVYSIDFKGTYTNYPPASAYTCFVGQICGCTMIYLFGQFYLNTYYRKRSTHVPSSKKLQ